MTTIHPRRLFTTHAVVAMLAGEDTCPTCRGEGRIEVNYPHERERRVCPTCQGDGIPPATRAGWTASELRWSMHHGRSSWKAARAPR